MCLSKRNDNFPTKTYTFYAIPLNSTWLATSFTTDPNLQPLEALWNFLKTQGQISYKIKTIAFQQWNIHGTDPGAIIEQAKGQVVHKSATVPVFNLVIPALFFFPILMLLSTASLALLHMNAREAAALPAGPHKLPWILLDRTVVQGSTRLMRYTTWIEQSLGTTIFFALLWIPAAIWIMGLWILYLLLNVIGVYTAGLVIVGTLAIPVPLAFVTSRYFNTISLKRKLLD